MKPSILPILIGSVAASAHALATENHIETTIVTASRTEQTLSEALAPVTVFERADIERIAPLDLQELLSRAAGLTLSRTGGRGGNTSLFIRGNDTDHTLVMIDGVRIGSATSGSASLTNLPTELIERVEIVRGPRSALYGSDAIGGVINIITRKYHSTQGVSPFLQVTAGSEGTLKGVAAVTGGNAQTQFSLTTLAEETDGIDNTASKTFPHGDDDGFEQQAFNLSASHKFSRNAEVFALLQQSDSESDFDTTCYGAAFATYDCKPYTDSRVTVANLRGEFQLTDWWQLTASLGQSTDESQTRYRYLDSASVGVTSDVFDTTRQVITLQNDWALSESQLLSLGVERIDDEVDSTLSYGADSRQNDAAFVQWQGEFGPIATALGWRNDRDEQFGSTDTRNASAGLELGKGVRFVVSYGEGFHAPTFNDLYYPDYGNPNLMPESSVNREIALTGKTEWGAWSLNHFRNDVDNLIQYNPATQGPDQLDAAEINGYEVVVSSRIGQWQAEANATFLDATDARTGNDLRRRPERQLNLDLDRQWQRWGFNASLRLTSTRFEDTRNTDELPGYGLVDFGLSYQLSPSVKLQLAVKNAFDKDYVQARHSSFGDYQTLGRETLLSITYNPQ